MACLSCTPIDLIERQTQNITDGLFQQLTSPVLSIFGSLLLVYSAYLLLDSLLKGSISFQVIIKLIIATCIIRWSLNFTIFQSWFLIPLKDTVFSLVTNVISYASNKGNIGLTANSASGLVEAFENVFFSVLTIASSMKNTSMWLHFQAWFISVLAALPFAISLAYLIFTIIGYHLSIATIAGLGPIWILLFFLPSTRGMCYAAIKILIANSTELILSSVIITFALVCVKQSILKITSADFNGDVVPFLGGQGLVILILGFVCLFAQTLASSMAATIAGAPTTNKGFTAGLTGVGLMGATVMRYTPFARAAGVGAYQLGSNFLHHWGNLQEKVPDSSMITSMGRSIDYGFKQALHKLTDFKKFH